MSTTSDIKMKKRKAAPAVVVLDTVGKSDANSLEPIPAAVNESNAIEQQDGEDEDEIEVLSHAEQRKRRKLEKAKGRSQGADAVDGVDASQSEEVVKAVGSSSSKIDAAEPAKQSRSTYGIWVGNLSFKTDADKVSSFLFHSHWPILILVHLSRFSPPDRTNFLMFMHATIHTMDCNYHASTAEDFLRCLR